MIGIDNPILFSPNRITTDGTFTISNAAGDSSLLVDRDARTKWRSGGAGGTLVTMEHLFKDGSFNAKAYFDTFIMLEHNVRRWSLELWNGSEWRGIDNCDRAALNPDFGPNTLVQFDSRTSTKVRLNLKEPSVGEEYKIGELALAKELYQFQDGMFEYSEEHDEKDISYELAEGTMERMVVPTTDFKRLKYAARGQINFSTKAERDTLIAIKQMGLPFIWMPEPVARPERFFYVHWVGRWKERYSTPVKGVGFTVDFDFREV